MITLVLGGAGSGKSAAAEALVATLPPPVTYLATWVPSEDPEMQARVAAHRARRPAAWASKDVEGDLAQALLAVEGSVLVDALGTWVAASPDFAVDSRGLCEALRHRAGDSVVVSDEVGLGVHPATDSGRRFRDALGAVNQAVAAEADDVWLVVAGQVLALAAPPWGSR